MEKVSFVANAGLAFRATRARELEPQPQMFPSPVLFAFCLSSLFLKGVRVAVARWHVGFGSVLYS